jgi:hypothetical protein
VQPRFGAVHRQGPVPGHAARADDRLGAARATEQEALPLVTAEAAQHLELPFALDALGHHRLVRLAREGATASSLHIDHIDQDRLALAPAQAEVVVELHGVADDLGREAEAGVRVGRRPHARHPVTPPLLTPS